MNIGILENQTPPQGFAGSPPLMLQETEVYIDQNQSLEPGQLTEQIGIESVFVIDSPEAVAVKGLSENDLSELAHQISAEIEMYNAENPGEMIPKTAEEILANIRLGNSAVIAFETGGAFHFLYHGAYYPLLTSRQAQQFSFGCQLIEYGSSIIPARFRGQSLAALGYRARILAATQRYGANSASLATIKQHRTGGVWRKVGGIAVPWDRYPYAAFLACSCTTSPTATVNSCTDMRTPAQSTTQLLHDATYGRGDSMPCTLVTLSPIRLEGFDDLARNYHGILIENGYLRECAPVQTGPDSLTPEAFHIMQQFYHALEDPRVPPIDVLIPDRCRR